MNSDNFEKTGNVPGKRKAVIYALLGGLFWAISNTIQAEFSYRLGVRSVSMFSIGSLSSWAIFHILNYRYKFEKESVYFTSQGINWFKLCLPVLRSFLSLFTSCLILLTFYFLGQSSKTQNSGIITSIFASSIIFSTINFRIFYGQIISNTTITGMTLILLSIILISCGKEDNDIIPIQSHFFHLSVLTALITGFCFSMILLTTKILVTRYDFPAMQLNYDVNLSYGLLLLPYFIYDTNKNGMFLNSDILLSLVSFYFQNIGCVFITYAVKYGQGGTVDAVDNLKCLWQTLMVIVLSGFKQIPTLLQITGMFLGIIGATIIFQAQNDDDR